MPLSIVIPAYNEQGRLPGTLPRIQTFLTSPSRACEIIVVDDGSSDGTAGVIADMQGRFPQLRLLRNDGNRGKGYSVRRGMLEARGAHVLFTDADLSTPIEEVDKLLPWFDRGFEVVIGSRAMRESRIVRHQPGYREAMGRVFNLMAQSWALRGIRDTQCGFKCFRREAAHDVFSRQTLSGFCFDVEALYIASRLGYRIKEVPVTWANSPETKVRALRDSTRMFMDLLKIRARHRGLTRAIRR